MRSCGRGCAVVGSLNAKSPKYCYFGLLVVLVGRTGIEPVLPT